MSSPTKYKLTYRVPLSALESTKTAIFAAGAGRYPGEQYEECCFITIGKEQFRPTAKANPYIGKAGELEQLEEANVETLCVGEDVARAAVKALKE